MGRESRLPNVARAVTRKLFLQDRYRIMVEYADLEIGLHRRDASSYTVEFRFSQPNSEADVRIGQDQAAQAAIDLDELNKLVNNPTAYSQKLTESVCHINV